MMNKVDIDSYTDVGVASLAPIDVAKFGLGLVVAVDELIKMIYVCFC